MVLSGFRHGLFSRLLTVCVSAALVLKAWQGREERRDDVAVVTFRPNDRGAGFTSAELTPA